MDTINLLENVKLVNSDEQPLLHIACQNNDLRTAKFLLENEAFVDYQDENWDTPLLISCRHKEPNLEIIKLLLKYDADVELPNKGGITPLQYVCKYICLKNCLNIYKLFIEKYKNIDLNKGSNSNYLLSNIPKIKKMISNNLKSIYINEIRDLAQSLYFTFETYKTRHEIIYINREFVEDLLLELETYGYVTCKNDTILSEEKVIYYRIDSGIGTVYNKLILDIKTDMLTKTEIGEFTLSNFNYKFEDDINLEIIKLVPDYVCELNRGNITLQMLYYLDGTKYEPNFFDNNNCITKDTFNNLLKVANVRTFIKKYNEYIINDNSESKRYAFLGDIIQTGKIIIDLKNRLGTNNFNANAYVWPKYINIIENEYISGFKYNSIIISDNYRIRTILITDYYLSKVYKRCRDECLKKLATVRGAPFRGKEYSDFKLFLEHLVNKKYLTFSDIRNEDLGSFKDNPIYRILVFKHITDSNYSDEICESLLNYDKIYDIVEGVLPLCETYNFYLQYSNYINIIKNKLIVKVLSSNPLYYEDFLELLATEFSNINCDNVIKDIKYIDLLNYLVNKVPNLILKCDIKAITSFSNKNIKTLHNADKLTLELACHIAQYNGKILKYVEDPAIYDIALCTNYRYFVYIKKQLKDNVEYVLNIDGLLLRYVRKQTENYCIIAVKQNKKAYNYIDKILLNKDFINKLVSINGLVLKYIRKQDTTLCETAIANNPKSIKYVKNQTTGMCDMILNNYPHMIMYLNDFI